MVVAHRNGFKTYYGHLSAIKSNLHEGSQVKQSDVIGYVGSTGLATGPHLHYEIRQGGAHINPLRFKVDAGESITAAQMGEFRKVAGNMDSTFASAAFDNKKQAQGVANPTWLGKYYFSFN